jgi:hypothetical protein
MPDGERDPCEPYLGCASTREILTELSCRGEIAALMNPECKAAKLQTHADHLLKWLTEEELDYRTVDA